MGSSYSEEWSGADHSHTESDADTPSAEHRSVGRPRKSINKVLDKVINAADVPLPESPVSV